MTKNSFIIGLVLNLSVYASSNFISSSDEETMRGGIPMEYMHLDQTDLKQHLATQGGKVEQLEDYSAYNGLPDMYKKVIDESFGGIIGLRSIYNDSNSDSNTVKDADESMIDKLYNKYSIKAVEYFANHGNKIAQWIMYQEMIKHIKYPDSIENIQKIKFVAYIWLMLSANSNFYLAENDAQYLNYIGNDPKSLSQILYCSYNQAIRW